MKLELGFKPLALILGLLALLYAAVFLIKLISVRRRVLELKRQGLVRFPLLNTKKDFSLSMDRADYRQPMPPYNPIFGHLLFCNRIMSGVPKDAHLQYLPDQIRRAMPELGPNYYIDTWPFGPVMLVVSSPSTMSQITQEHSLPKHPGLRSFLLPLTDGLDIVTMEGQQWKRWRSIYNPGFSANHLMALVPDIVHETAIFCQLLQEHADKGDIFAMKDYTDNLAIDVMGKVVL